MLLRYPFRHLHRLPLTLKQSLRAQMPAERVNSAGQLAYASQAAAILRATDPATKEQSHVYGNFDLLQRFKLDSTDVTVSRWRSRMTGLSLVHLDYDAPIVNGYFAVGTEIFNDSGVPHTLEHLVFMGSQKYPYKGIIDNFANRGFSNGTNAWTDTDHTCYTASTAGAQGFLQLLPIYVDHILYPIMSKAGFITEVHHIDPHGHDSGVVYSEMQGRENTSGSLMRLRYQRLVYPKGSAYRSETGGLMEALRALTVEQIRDYHATHYVPHNLSLIVTGKLTNGTESLLDVVQHKIEPSLIGHGQDKGPRPPGWRRPFLETTSAIRPRLEKSFDAVVEFPERDESVGELLVGFMGPPPENHLERKAIDILGTYLTSSPVAPLNKEFVEIENPLCTYIYFDEDVRASRVDLPVYIGSVPSEWLDKFDGLLKDALSRIAREGIDMAKMSMVLSRDQRQLRSKLESSKGDTFATEVIFDFLLGPDDGSGLHAALDEMSYYDTLRSWKNEDWASLLKRYYVDAPSVVIRGKPSAALVEKLDKEEKSRIKAQVERLGEEGLAKAKKELEDAKAEHDRPVPPDVLKSFPLPDVKSISWIPIQSAREGTEHQTSPTNRTDNSELLRHINSEGSGLPFFVQFDHVQSDFVTLNALLSLKNVPNNLRPLVTVYLQTFFSLPVRRSSGERLSHEDVVNKLDDETVSYDAGLGNPYAFPELFRVSIKVETGMYEAGVQWLRDLLYGSEFTAERLQVALAKLNQSLPELKRDGDNVMNAVSSSLLYDESSTSRQGNILALSEVVPALIKQVEENPERILADFTEMRQHIVRLSAVRFSVTGNVIAVKTPRSAWSKSFGDLQPGDSLEPVPHSSENLSKTGRNPKHKAIVVGLPSTESSYATYTSKSIAGFDHPEYPAQRVAVEVLSATESYLWKYIRGSGLAYGASVSLDIESGHLNFSLYRSSNSMQALHEAANVVRGLVDGSIMLDDTTLDSAKSAIVYNVTKSVSTPTRAAAVSFANQALKNVSQTHNMELLEKFHAVTKEDVLIALKKYFLPLFDAQSSVAVVVTTPSKVESTKAGLTELGFQVEEMTLRVEAEDPSESDGGDESSSESNGSSR